MIKTPFLFPVKKIKDSYLLKDTLIGTNLSKIGFAIGAYDCVSGSTSPNGIYAGRIFLDEQPLLEFVLDSMDYDETDFVNAHIDYKYRYNGGPYLQLLFKLPGDNGRAYRLKKDDGTVILNDTNVHAIRIEISDIKGNTSNLNFGVKHNSNPGPLVTPPLHRSYAPDNVNIFEQNDFELYLEEDCLYDSIQPVFDRVDQPGASAISSSFRFADASIPVHGEINIRIKPDVPVPGQLTDKVVIKRTDAKNINYRKAEWQQQWVAAKFDALGSYQALIDTASPSVNGLGNADTVDLSPSKKIVFYPKDNTEVQSFRAELDGEWLMFTNDKAAAWVYTFDERCPFGVHRLKVRIEDIAGNVTEKEWWFKRYPYSPPKKKAASKKKTSGKKQVPNKKKTTNKKK